LGTKQFVETTKERKKERKRKKALQTRNVLIVLDSIPAMDPTCYVRMAFVKQVAPPVPKKKMQEFGSQQT
jgi:hypothetical protein